MAKSLTFKSLSKIWNFALDLLFPIKCIGCQKEGKFLCDECLSSITLNKIQNCPNCGKPSILGRFCKKCNPKINLVGIIAAAPYENKLLQKAIHVYKYKFVKELASPLGQILIKIFYQTLFQDSTVNFKNIVFVPVPLHKKRLLFRGFNQAELLAQKISSHYHLPLIPDVLIKTRNTKPQIELDGTERKENVKNAFLCINYQKIKGKIIILVDDVSTTSATLIECAKVFGPATPKAIWGLVLAKG